MDVLVGRRQSTDAVPTSESLQTFHETVPRWITTAITARSVDLVNMLAIEGLMDDDDLLGHARANANCDAKVNSAV